VTKDEAERSPSVLLRAVSLSNTCRTTDRLFTKPSFLSSLHTGQNIGISAMDYWKIGTMEYWLSKREKHYFWFRSARPVEWAFRHFTGQA
jgi:hypothetical protein